MVCPPLGWCLPAASMEVLLSVFLQSLMLQSWLHPDKTRGSIGSAGALTASPLPPPALTYASSVFWSGDIQWCLGDEDPRWAGFLFFPSLFTVLGYSQCCGRLLPQCTRSSFSYVTTGSPLAVGEMDSSCLTGAQSSGGQPAGLAGQDHRWKGANLGDSQLP